MLHKQDHFNTLSGKKSHQKWQTQTVSYHLYLNTVIRQKCKKVGNHFLARHGITNYHTHQNCVQMPLSRTEIENEPSHQNTKAPHFMVIPTPVIILHF